MRVLLVEDNALNRELAQDLLEGSGNEVRVATNGAELRHFIGSGRQVEVVLMDILLPDGSGEALLRELRAATHTAQIPVVAVTAHALRGDRERLMACGFTAVLTKPIDTRTFVAQVEGWANDGDSAGGR